MLDAPDPKKPLSELASGSKPAKPQRYAFRSFDRQWLIPDNRIGDFMRTSLWAARSNKQIYFTSLFTNPLGSGPAVVVCADIPDLHMFRGSFGAKDAFPLFRDAAANEPNILPRFLTLWGEKLKREIKPQSFAAYVYAVLGHNGFVDRFWGELEDCQLRVPLTLDAKRFDEAVVAGSRLLLLHTYGERYGSKGRTSDVSSGKAKVKTAISEKPNEYPEEFHYLEDSRTLRVGSGAIGPVDPTVWHYEVSGLQIVHSWLAYRMKKRKGKKSSPLDNIHPERWTSEFTDELLRLLWILEATIAMESQLSKLLDAVCSGPLLLATELPEVPDSYRKAPRVEDGNGLFPDDEESESNDDAED